VQAMQRDDNNIVGSGSGNQQSTSGKRNSTVMQGEKQRWVMATVN